ncbi:MAG: hypothetical protein Q9227_002473 [Pyrenula ochraceoflavens]
MQIRFLSSISTTLNPFSPLSKTPRLFLTRLPPNTRTSGIKVTVKTLPRADKKTPQTLDISFKDGKELKFRFAVDEKLEKEESRRQVKELPKVEDVVAEVERHSRILGRKEDLGLG